MFVDEYSRKKEIQSTGLPSFSNKHHHHLVIHTFIISCLVALKLRSLRFHSPRLCRAAVFLIQTNVSLSLVNTAVYQSKEAAERPRAQRRHVPLTHILRPLTRIHCGCGWSGDHPDCNENSKLQGRNKQCRIEESWLDIAQYPFSPCGIWPEASQRLPCLVPRMRT